MSSTTDKIKAYANQAGGTAKEKIGRVTGSGQTETQGNLQAVKGKAQVAAGKTKDARQKSCRLENFADGSLRVGAVRISRISRIGEQKIVEEVGKASRPAFVSVASDVDTMLESYLLRRDFRYVHVHVQNQI